MDNIVLIYDDVSKDVGEQLYIDLTKNGFIISKKGNIPIYAHGNEEDIIGSLHEIVKGASFVLGVSSSGNGIAIYVNKISGFTAASITSLEDAVISVQKYGANTLDISSDNKDVFWIYRNFLERRLK